MQRRNQQANPKKSGLFIYLLSLTALFILVEISLFVQSNEAYLGNYQLVSDRLHIPVKVLPEILFFLSVELALHFLFAVFVWVLAQWITYIFSFTQKQAEKMAFSIWLITLFTLLLANQVYFPNSKFAELTGMLLSPAAAKIFLGLFVGLLCLVMLIAVVGWVLRAPKMVFSALSVVFVVIGFFYYSSQSIVGDGATKETPNIILIGIDSLRPDFLGYFGYEKITPHLDNFLNQATVFSDALTPIARTFPSWMSILTGEYPKHNGVRFNLPSLAGLSWSTTLPRILQKNGYETVFATDETRFSNIDEQFGFDKVITPPVGFNDFLIGTMNDFPLSNLLVNTPIGKYLFPFSYGNRPAITTYDPTTFLNLLEPTLAQSRTRPLFLAVHFCLPHYPYIWGGELVHDKSIENYKVSVQRVDQQFQDFLVLLQKNNVLKHSIVVVLSDHGEAMELVGDRVTDPALFIPGRDNPKNNIPRFYPPTDDSEKVNQSAGHGTDILSMSQYHTVLAFRWFGLEKQPTKIISNKVSLLDIKPTLLTFLNIPFQAADGHSLVDLIFEGKQKMDQDFFMETDFSPQAIRSVHPETKKLLFEGIHFFQVDPKTARITVKEHMGKLIVSSKQYADVYGEWILALYPQSKAQQPSTSRGLSAGSSNERNYITDRIPILVNLRTGEWTNDLHTPFAVNSPAQHMLQALREFYGEDVATAPRANEV